MTLKFYELEAPTVELLGRAFGVARDALKKLNPAIRFEEFSNKRKTRSSKTSQTVPITSITSNTSDSSSAGSSPSPPEKVKANKGGQPYDDTNADIVAGPSGHFH